MEDAVRADFPPGMRPLDRWTYRDVECAVGSVGRLFYGLARVGEFSHGWSSKVPSPALSPEEQHAVDPDNLGQWVAIPVEDASQYWSSEVLSRVVTAASPDLVAWDTSGHTWAMQHVRDEVETFVDDILGGVPEPRSP